MVYYPKDVLERKVTAEKDSNIRYYFFGETIKSHYGDLCKGAECCTFNFIYYNSAIKDFNELRITINSYYQESIDMLSELCISEAEFKELLSYVSSMLKGSSNYVYVIKYKNEIKCTLSVTDISFWKSMILNELATKPINRFWCSGYEIKDGVIIVNNEKSPRKDKVVEVYDNNVIKVIEY